MKKQLKKWSAYLLAMSLALSMGVPRIANAESPKQTEPATLQEDGALLRQEERGEKEEVWAIAEGQYDTTKPVIEKVEFPQNGQTLKIGDTVKLYVYAYDAESGIESVSASLYYKKGSENAGYTDLTVVYDESAKRYELSCVLSKKEVDSAAIDSIRVVDKSGNYTNWYCYTEDGDGYKYQVQIEPEQFPVVSVRNFMMTPNQQLIKNGESLDVSFELEGEGFPTDEPVEVTFLNDKGYSYYNVTAWYDASEGKYKGTESIYSGESSVQKWSLVSISQDTDGGEWEFQMENMEDFWYETEANPDPNPEPEVDTPKITSIILEKNGEVLKKGDKAVISIQVASEEAMQENGTAIFYPTADIVNGDIWVDLQYDVGSSTYTGVFEVTEETYPCEWYLGSIRIQSETGEWADLSEAYPYFYQEDPFYLNVTDGTTFVSPTYDVSYTIYTFGKDGDWKKESEFSKEGVERRTTLKEAGLVFPEVQEEYKGLKQIGWMERDGREVDENTQIIHSAHSEIYAKYDKIPVSIDYWSLDKNGDLTSKQEVVLFEEGSTYQDISDYLAKQSAPKTDYQDLEFQHWSIQNAENLNEPLTGVVSVTANAVYDKVPVIIQYEFMGDSGYWTSKRDIVLFEGGSTYQDVSDYFAKQGVPEEAYKDLPFTHWETTGIPDSNEPITGILSVIADAKYDKILVPISYEYADDKGNFVSKKDVALFEEGSTYQDVSDHLAKQGAPEVSYEGLNFKHWAFKYPTDLDTPLGDGKFYITVEAVYDKAMVDIAYNYLNEIGHWTGKDEIVLFPEGSTYQDVSDYLMKQNGPDGSYKYLTFKGWTFAEEQDLEETLTGRIAVRADAVYDKIPAFINYQFVDGEGIWKNEEKLVLFPEGSTYQDVSDYLAKQGAPDSTYSAVKFQKWDLGNVQEEKPLGRGPYVSVIAEYDKNVTNATYSYVDKGGAWKSELKVVSTEKGLTYKEVQQQLEQYQIQDGMSGIEFAGWENNLPNTDQIVHQGSARTVECNATYEGKSVLVPELVYYDEHGFMESKNGTPIVVDKGMTYEEAYELLLEKQGRPKVYEGLRFSKWRDFRQPGVVQADYEKIYGVAAEYENYMIRYVIDDGYKYGTLNQGYYYGSDFEYIKCQVAEKGETVTVPESFDGYKDVTWVYRETEEDTFKVEHHMMFQGYGEKDDPGTTDPEEPEEPDKPEDPEEPNKPVDPEEPDKPIEPEEPDKPTEPEKPANPQLPQNQIENIVNDVNNASDGESITVLMDGATVVPKDVLEAAQGKDVEIKLDMGGYTWTINGKDILAENLKDINLEVKQNTDAIPNKVIQSLAGDNPTQQLSLTHNGDFGFKANLTVNVGSEHQGKYGNLFYYDSDGKVVFINAGKVDANGNVTLSFSHASDYVVVMNEQKMSDRDVPDNLRPNTKADGAVKTGDSSHAALPAAVAMLAVLVFVAAAKRKKSM